MNQVTQLKRDKRRVSRVFSYTEEDIENLVMKHFLLNHDEDLPEHFVADIKFVGSPSGALKLKPRVNVHVR